MFALTTILKSSNSDYEVHEGCVFKIPVELRSRSRIDRYLEVKNPGWGVDDLGYSLFSRFDFNGNMIIVPGLILEGAVNYKKIHDYKQKFSKSQIEKYVDGIILLEKAAFEAASENVNMLVHDLRNISGSIYNAALEADTYINRNEPVEAKVRIGNVIAAQGILKIRTDVLDFLGNPASILRSGKFQIYPKFDKVCRVFKPKAQERRIRINFSGRSHHDVEGPEVFEIIPYVLIDNAIKYSPDGSVITALVEDDFYSVRIEVTSLGPRIATHEHASIFEKGIRGESAQEGAFPGTGLGLFLLKQMVEEHFSGSVTVAQYDEINLYSNGKGYYETSFLISIPAVSILKRYAPIPRVRFL